MFKNVIISALAATVLMQTGFCQPENMVQAMIIPVVWYVVFVISLTWIDLRRVTKVAKRKDSQERSEKNQTR